MTPTLIKNAAALAQLILKLGQVQRITEDAGGRAESDTTHSLMLALLAAEVAQQEQGEPLDLAAVLGMALVHDLAEAYAGDTPTLQALSPKERREKEAREIAAIQRVYADVEGFQWITSMIERYEMQACRESRLVRVLDKALPKLTHTLNGCSVPHRRGMSREEFVAQHDAQMDRLSPGNTDLPVTLEFLTDACEASEQAWPQEAA
jgi:5'-deoxynucleotidase YfbR-like HD superfamily hydrolase